MNYKSHYDWLKAHLMEFFKGVGLNTDWYNNGIITAHGDKCYGYRQEWADAGIPFERGVAIYLLTYCAPFSGEVRDTDNGWVDPSQWVIDNYSRFEQFFPEG